MILEANPMVAVVGLDQDPDALAAAAELLSAFGDRVTLRRARFDSLVTVMSELGFTSISGAVFDLGVSSPQLDRAERGFSYRHDGPLDMRMDPDSDLTAADIVNGYAERRAGRGAPGRTATSASPPASPRRSWPLVRSRPPLSSPTIVRDAIPAPARRRGGHPAKRTFQAIRIEVNRELEMLARRRSTTRSISRAPGGRCAVLVVPLGRGPHREGPLPLRRDRRLHLPARSAVRVRCGADGPPA